MPRFFLVLFLLGGVQLPSTLFGAEGDRPEAVRALLNQPIAYRIRVLWMFDVGTVSFRLIPAGDSPSRFIAVSEAHPSGLVRSLTQFREGKYEAELEFDDASRTFSVKRVTEFVRRANKSREVRLTMEADGWHRIAFTNGKQVSDQSGPLDPDAPTWDPLAAFYNFALGTWGEPSHGAAFEIPILSRSGVVKSRIHFFPAPEAVERLDIHPDSEFGGRIEFEGTYMDLKLREVLLVTDRHFVPLRAVIPNAGWLGRIEAFRIQ